MQRRLRLQFRGLCATENGEVIALLGRREEMKNGREVGHHTRHLDKDGRLIHENYHGITSVPEDAKLA